MNCLRKIWHLGPELELPTFAVERLGSINFVHPRFHGTITPLPNEDAFLTAAHDSIRIFDKKTGYPKTIVQLAGRLSTYAISSKQDMLAFGLHDLGGFLWRIGTDEFKAFGAAKPTVQSLAFSPDGSLLALGDYEGKVEIRSLPSLEVLEEFSMGQEPVDSVVFSPSGKRLAIAANFIIPAAPDANEAFIRLLDLEKKETLLDTSFEGDWTWLSFIDERYITDVVKSYYALDTHTGEHIMNTWGPPHREPFLEHIRTDKGFLEYPNVEKMALSPDEKHLATQEGLWNLPKRTFHHIERRFKHVIGLGFSADSAKLQSIFSYDQEEIFDVATSKAQITSRKMGKPNSAAISPTGKVAALWRFRNKSSQIRLYTLPDWKELHTIEVNGHYATDVAFTADGQKLYTLSSHAKMEKWDIDQGTLEATTAFDTKHTRYLTVAKNEKRAATYIPDEQQVLICELAQDTKTLNIPIPDTEVTTLALSPNEPLLAVACDDWTIRLIDLDTKATVKKLEGHLGVITNLQFAKDSHRLYSSSRDGTIIVWDV